MLRKMRVRADLCNLSKQCDGEVNFASDATGDGDNKVSPVMPPVTTTSFIKCDDTGDATGDGDNKVSSVMLPAMALIK